MVVEAFDIAVGEGVDGIGFAVPGVAGLAVFTRAVDEAEGVAGAVESRAADALGIGGGDDFGDGAEIVVIVEVAAQPLDGVDAGAVGRWVGGNEPGNGGPAGKADAEARLHERGEEDFGLGAHATGGVATEDAVFVGGGVGGEGEDGIDTWEGEGGVERASEVAGGTAAVDEGDDGDLVLGGEVGEEFGEVGAGGKGAVAGKDAAGEERGEDEDGVADGAIGRVEGIGAGVGLGACGSGGEGGCELLGVLGELIEVEFEGGQRLGGIGIEGGWLAVEDGRGEGFFEGADGVAFKEGFNAGSMMGGEEDGVEGEIGLGAGIALKVAGGAKLGATGDEMVAALAGGECEGGGEVERAEERWGEDEGDAEGGDEAGEEVGRGERGGGGVGGGHGMAPGAGWVVWMSVNERLPDSLVFVKAIGRMLINRCRERLAGPLRGSDRVALRLRGKKYPRKRHNMHRGSSAPTSPDTAPMADLKNLKGISQADKQLLTEAEEWLGAEPTKMGPVKNFFWGVVKEDFYFPYPTQDAREQAECDQLLARLDDYLKNEHPAVAIDQEQEIPRWVVDKLFKLGVLGMTIPKEYGGLGLGITSYNRVLERIGWQCGSTAVMVSAHQSIGCKAVMLFGSEEQKKKWLPHLAQDWLSAFCLSEPNVGCDAGGAETYFEKDGDDYVVYGEKKWATSGALAGLFTVMAREKTADGKGKISALVMHPEMPGVEIYQKNRSKCGIRGTWQARIRFHGVRVHKANLLGKEGRGLQMALSCLNYGRCTLSAGMLGGARRVRDQATKWATTRFQFGQPLAHKELVRSRIAHMAALDYAMDAVLYMTTGMLDRHEEDHQVETAICKVFCSEMGWRVVNDGMQIMGGESYMSENEVERVFRDSRINLIVEGANEIMQCYVFGYGGKQLAEQMLGIKDALLKDSDESIGAFVSKAIKNSLNARIMKIAIPLGLEVFLGIRRPMSRVTKCLPEFRPAADRMSNMARELSYQFKVMSKKWDVKILDRQSIQARLGDVALYLHAWACTLAKLDSDARAHGGNGATDLEFQRDKAAALHFFDIAELEINNAIRLLNTNADDTMLAAADAALKWSASQANSQFIIPEKSPIAKGTGMTVKQDGIKQFPGTPNVDAPAGAHV